MLPWLLSFLSGSLACDRYMCTPSSVSLSPDTCISFSELPQGSAYLLQKCMDEHFSYCDPIPTSGNSSCAVPPAVPPIPAEGTAAASGEPCTYDLDCWGESICEEGVCVNLGTSCSGDEACNPEFFCNVANATCLSQVSASSFCSKTSMCSNAYGCHDNTCTPYLTLPPGEVVETCDSGFNMLCQSQLCFGKTKFTCAGNEASLREIPVECETDTDCPSDNSDFNGTCQCSYGTLGKSYCSLFPGDEPMALLLKDVQKWIDGAEINKCNTARRFSPSCMQLYMSEEDSVTYFYHYYYAVNYPALQDMDQCASTIYVQDFFSAQEAYEAFINNKTQPTSEAQGIAVAVSLVASLLI